MALEGATLFGYLAYLGEGEYLESAAVGEDGPVPRSEGVESARPAEDVESGTQIEVVCVAQDYLGPYVVLQVAVIYPFDASYRSHGHKDGGLYHTVVGIQETASGIGRAVGGYDLEIHCRKIS